jgi:hypothetical protein
MDAEAMQMNKKDADDALVQRARFGDHAAFGELVPAIEQKPTDWLPRL